MQRLNQLVFIISILTLGWLTMSATHEFGHIVGAVVTGGQVQEVVLHPLSISRTDVSPNPHPLVVVWLGPVLGCVIPLVCWLSVPRRLVVVRHILLFISGFCLLANGAYISVGAIDRVGDCGVMLQHGSPLWLLIVFGLLTIPVGLFVWHQMGSPAQLLKKPSITDATTTWLTFTATVSIIAIEIARG